MQKSSSLSFKTSKLEYFTLFLGNLLEHYDKALYALLAPYIASIFFPLSSSHLSLALFFLPLSIFIKPLGALFIGKYGDLLGKQKALYFSLVGISLSTSCIGLLPSYSQIGILSPLLLYFFRLCMDFFSIGERSGAILIILEKTQEGNKSFISSIYESTAMVGYLFAAGTISLLYYFDYLMDYWRLLFFSSLITGACGVYLRSRFKEIDIRGEIEPTPLLPVIRKYKNAFITILLMVGFSYANYEIAVKMLHSLFSIAFKGNASLVLFSTTLVVCLDILLFPICGLVSKKIPAEKMIRYSLMTSAFVTIPIFQLLKNPSLSNLLLVRCVLIFIGVVHASTLQYWMVSILPKERRYTMLALGKALGATLIGHSSVSLSFYLYDKTQWILVPAVYITLSAILALVSLRFVKRPKLKEAQV